MSNERQVQTGKSESWVYQIRIKGHVSRNWTDWFECLTVTLEDNGETVFTVRVIDQPALYGLLRNVRDLGLPLLSVVRLEPKLPDVPANPSL